LKLIGKVEATLVSPGKPLEIQSTDRLLVLASARRMQAGSSVSKTPARVTLAAKDNCFVLSVGNQDTLPENAFRINFLKKRGEECVFQITRNGKVKLHLC